MTNRRFDNYPDLTASLAFDLRDRINAADWNGADASARFGASNQSCSTYVEVSFSNDALDTLETVDGESDFKVRFSNHADRHGSSITLRIDDLVIDIEDEVDGSHIATEIAEDDYEAIIIGAMDAVVAFRASATEIA